MTDQQEMSSAGEGSLPKGLIAGTVLFAALAAAAVAALIYMGKQRSQTASSQEMERRAINISREELSRRE